MATTSLGLLSAAGALALAACGQTEKAAEPAQPAAAEEGAFQPTEQEAALIEPPVPVVAETPEMNARRGRILFISNGCVICHQVNGVGGKAAPDLSADAAATTINPLDFSARMWRGAPAMTGLQAIELGYVIQLEAQDIADLAAFAGSVDEQKLLTIDSVGAEMRTWFLDEPHWRSGDWSEFLKRGERIPGEEPELP